MKFEPYKFQNIYMIVTYRCNWDCDFCLFKYNNEHEATTEIILDRLEYSIIDSSKDVYLKITGGEPFLKQELLEAVFAICRKYKDKIYKIGIGTNGSMRLKPFFNNIINTVNIFLSRHDLHKVYLTPTQLKAKVQNDNIDFRINCNLIKNGIDSIRKIEEYINVMHAKTGITHYCFRELSKVDINKNFIYPKEIYQYADYYSNHVIPFSELQPSININNNFIYSKFTGNYYDKNHWFWYGDKQEISVKFRIIDEVKLVEYNTLINQTSVDEYVIHPDGTLSGCWDKGRKIIMKGG